MADPSNSITVATGSSVVTGTGTQFSAAQMDLFVGGGAVGLIDAMISPTELRLRTPWAGPPLSGTVNWNIVNVGPYWHSTVATNQLLNTLLRKFEAGPVKWDASGTFAERDSYNGQRKDFVFLAVDPLPFRLFVKLSNDNSAAAWSAGQILGDRGPVAFEEAIILERDQRIEGYNNLAQLIADLSGDLGGGGAIDERIMQAVQAEAATRFTEDGKIYQAILAGDTQEGEFRDAGDLANQQRIAAEETARAQAITAEANARMAADNAEAGYRFSDVGALYNAILAGDTLEGQNRETRIGDVFTALAAEAAARAADTANKAGRYVEGLNGGLAPAGSMLMNRRRRNLTGFVFAGSGNYAWVAVGYRPQRRVAGLKSCTFHLADTANVDRFVLQIWSRPAADADNNVAPGTAPDKLVSSPTYFSSVVITNPILPRTGNAFPIQFDLSGLNLPALDPALVYWFKLYGQDANGQSTPIGFAEGLPDGNTSPIYSRGWFANAVVAVPMGNDQTIAFQLEESVGRSTAVAPSVPTRVDVVVRSEMQLFWPNTAAGANIPAMVIRSAIGEVAIPLRGTIYSMPPTVEVTDEQITLQYLSGQNLGHQYVANVSIVRQSDRSPLALGVDYSIDFNSGQVKGLKNTNVPVYVTYRGFKQRIDVLYADPATGAIGVVQGINRGTDPQEYIPAVPDGMVALFNVHVTVGAGIELIPVFQFRNFAPTGGEAEQAAWIAESRRRLPKLARAMTMGAPITYIVYTDSIGEQGSSDSSNFNVPNGQSRERLTYFYTGKVGADTIGTIPLYDTGDGAGKVHTREGMHWRLIEAIQERCGSSVTVKNLGIGGSASDNSAPNGRPNGTDSTRLAALTSTIAAAVALGHVVVVEIGFGMNELGSPFTMANILAIIRACKAAGAEVIVRGVPLFAGNSNFATIDQWRETNRQVMAAGEQEKVALWPLHRICDPVNLGALGIPWRLASGANGINHPIMYELRTYGRFGALLIPEVGGTPFDKGYENAYLKAQFALTGGGVVTWGGPGQRFNWTARFIAIPLPKSTFPSQMFQIGTPTDIPAAQVYNGIARTNNNGIILNNFEALWAVHTPYTNSGVTLYITHWQTAFEAPSNWILLAVTNGDDATLRLAGGQILQSANGWRSYTPTVQAFTPGDTPPTFSIVTAKWRRVGSKTIELRWVILCTSAGTGAGAVLITLPTGMVTADEDCAYGDEKAISGRGLAGRIDAGANVFTVVYSDGSYPGQTNARLALRATIEIA